MVSLSLSNLVKIIIGALVFVVVISGLFWFFRNYVIDFFKNVPGTGGFVLSLI